MSATKKNKKKKRNSYISYIGFCNWWSSNWAEALPNTPHHSTENPKKCSQFRK